MGIAGKTAASRYLKDKIGIQYCAWQIKHVKNTKGRDMTYNGPWNFPNGKPARGTDIGWEYHFLVHVEVCPNRFLVFDNLRPTGSIVNGATCGVDDFTFWMTKQDTK